MEQQLFELFERWKGRLIGVRTRLENKGYGPFLVSPHELYSCQQTRLVIVGQETRTWENENDVKHQMDYHKAFYETNPSYRSPFHQVTRKLETVLGAARYSCAWCNFNKFDLGGKRPLGRDAEIIAELDELLKQELRILNPSFCIFYTGPSLDERLQKLYAGVEYCTVPGWKERGLCQLAHPLLPKMTFRSYHPSFLRRRGKEALFVETIRQLAARN